MSTIISAGGVTVEQVTWFFAALCSIAIVARSIIKWHSIAHIGADDVFIWGGFICLIGQCASAQMQVLSGLGQSVELVPTETHNSEMMAELANYLLYMPVIAFSKLSVVSVLRKCALKRKDRVLLYSFEWALAAWAITSELVRGFGCHFPQPWNYLHNTCISKLGWVVFFEIANMLTELALIIIPTINIMTLPLPTKKKLIATSFFWARGVIIPVIILRIVYCAQTNKAIVASPPYVICTMVVSSLEVLAACVLYARPLFTILETGCFTLASQHSKSRESSPPASPQFGPYSKGSWPFTRMSSLEDILTLNGGGGSYEAHVQASNSDLEKVGPPADDIHVHRQVDVLSSNVRQASRAELYAGFAPANTHCSDPAPWEEKDLPPTPRPERNSLGLR